VNEGDGLVGNRHFTDAIVVLLQVARAGFNDDPYVRDFNIGIDTKMVVVTGRILPPPLLQYGGKVRVRA